MPCTCTAPSPLFCLVDFTALTLTPLSRLLGNAGVGIALKNVCPPGGYRILNMAGYSIAGTGIQLINIKVWRCAPVAGSVKDTQMRRVVTKPNQHTHAFASCLGMYTCAEGLAWWCVGYSSCINLRRSCECLCSPGPLQGCDRAIPGNILHRRPQPQVGFDSVSSLPWIGNGSLS